MTGPGPAVLLVGATRGLGLGLWTCFGRDGWRVAAVGRNGAGRAGFPPGTLVIADLASASGLDEVRRLIREQAFGCVVYVAGIWESRPWMIPMSSCPT